MTRIAWALALALAVLPTMGPPLFAQAPPAAGQAPPAQPVAPAASKAAPKPEELAAEWFVRLNELDDWFISYDGKEENAVVVDRFLDLYADEAFHQVGPSANQIGTVLFTGKTAIRKWVDDFSKRYTALNYRIEYKTRKEKPLQPFYAIQFPWGGTGASTQFEAIFTNRDDRKQFVVPAAVFFMFNEAGKIESVRLYLLRDETAEIA